MNQDDLTKEQITRLSRMLFPSLNLMSRLQRRMDEATRVHYLRCSGVSD
jgi:hypothetical protein